MSPVPDKIYRAAQSTQSSQPVALTPISAGFPSPAEEYMDGQLDLNEHLIQHPAATFFIRVTGDSMIGAGIHSGDLLVVDRALAAVEGNVVIAAVNGDLTVKRICILEGQPMLAAENSNYSPIPIHEETNVELWGVVTHVIHALR